MPKLRTLFILSSVLFLASGAGALAAGRFNTDSGSFNSVALTTSQTAVFAALLVDQPADQGQSRIQTAISVSNVLAVPPGFQSDFLSPGGGNTTGTIEFYFWDNDSMYSYETGVDTSFGIGLNEDGTLGPGQTYTVLLHEVLAAAGYPAGEATFAGYGWIVGNFDGIAGTYNVTIFNVGFTQNFELLPGVGQGLSPVCGLPVRFNQ